MSSRKKILFVLPTAGLGGAERVTINIVRALDRRRFKVQILLLDRRGNYLDAVPSDVDLISLEGVRARYALFKVIRILWQESPDYVFSTHNYVSILLLTASIVFPWRMKFVVRVPNMPSAKVDFGHLSRSLKIMIQLLYPRADRVVAQTVEMRDEVIDHFRIAPEKIAVLTNPLDSEFINEQLYGATSPFSDGFTNVVSAGRLTQQKAFDVLIRAFGLVVEQEKTFRLYILGEGEERKNLERLIADEGLEDFVFMLGFQDNPYPFLKFADLYVLSSVYEGLPNVVLEALYLETPVVATNCIPFLNRIIREPANGAVVGRGDVAAMATKIRGWMKYQIEPSLLQVDGTITVASLFDGL